MEQKDSLNHDIPVAIRKKLTTILAEPLSGQYANPYIKYFNTETLLLPFQPPSRS